MSTDDLMIARALYEASNNHLECNDADIGYFRNDETGMQMRKILMKMYPDYVSALATADEFTEALVVGYVPPPEGTTKQSIEKYLRSDQAKTFSLDHSRRRR